MNINHVPEEMRQRDQWVLWKLIDSNRKCPFQISGMEAKSNDPSTWTTFDNAIKDFKARGYLGVGYMFSDCDPYCGIDLDGCRNPETNRTEVWAVDWLQKLQSYCEVSPSQTGWKVYCRGRNKHANGKKRDLDGDPICGKKPGVEIYDHLRWFAVTGQRGKYKEIRECQSEIDEFCDCYWPAFNSPAIPINTNEITERASRYVAKMPPAISGSSGHNAAYSVACVLVLGFGLTPEQAFPIFCQYNSTCEPPWSEREIWHKLNSANKENSERYYLRNTKEADWSTLKLPQYKESVSNIASYTRDTTFIPLRSAAEKYLASLDNGDPLIDMGVPDLNYALGGGVERGEMVILAARPSHGKSAFALQCLHTCAKNGMPGLIVSEEMSALALGRRTLQYVSGVPQEHWQRDKAIVERHVDMHFGKLQSIHIVESCRNIPTVNGAIKRAVDEHGIQLVVVDYAQMLVGSGKTKYEQTSNVSLALRQMANEYNVLLLALCQLSREIEGREKFVPRMTDLRDSGQLEQDADVIVFLVWPHKLDSKRDPFEYQIFVAKNRNRQINQVCIDKCRFDPSRQRFIEPKAIASTLEVFARDTF